MISKSLALAFGLAVSFHLTMPLMVTAQEPAPGQQIVPLRDAGFVAFKSETAWADRDKTTFKAEDGPASFAATAIIDESQTIHRLLSDKQGNIVFAYDLLVEPQPGAKKFRIVLNPLAAAYADKLLAAHPPALPSLRPRAKISTLPQSAEPQVLDDGDSFALDLLVNQRTGVKIVDIVKVTFDRTTLRDDRPTTVPRDFSLDAVEMSVKDYRLLINGEVVSAGKPASDWSGALLWFYTSDRGRFIFSLVPREGYHFQKVGMIENNRIAFSIDGDRYEWISNSPVLPGGGAWNLWVLHDPKYLPLIEETAPGSKKKPDKFNPMEAVLRKAQDKTVQLLSNKDTTFHASSATPAEPPPKRFRIIVGGADRIENLWPH